MPPKKLPPKTPQQKQHSQSQNASNTTRKATSTSVADKPAIPEQELKKNSAVSAQFALEAAKKAYELRQAAYGAGDPNAREEILAKAVNKEIEAESFGKAAKYTRSGAFQGLAAGAGLGVQPGVLLGQLTGAIVGGLLSSVGALLGGGIGSAYGAIKGPFWDLGQMASHGVRSIVGDFPNWEASSGQKKALEKMVLGAQQTKAPNQDELKEMRDDDGGLDQEEFQQFSQTLTSWIPNMPSMPSMPSAASIPSISSIPGFGGRSKQDNSRSTRNPTTATAKPSQSQQPKAPVKPRASPKPQSMPQKTSDKTTSSQTPQKVDDGTAKKRPRKLEIRSKTTAAQPYRPTAQKVPERNDSQKCQQQR